MNFDRIQEFAIFNGLTDEEIQHFQSVVKELTVPAGEEFIREGDIGDSIYLLSEGKVEINQALTLPMSRSGSDSREKAIIKLSSDQSPLFGEMSLFNKDDRRTASVIALTECHLGQIMKDDLFRICDQYPETGYKIMRNLCRILTANLTNANENVLKLTTAFSLALDR